MENRRIHILNTIIKEHIKTGAPVGSSVLVEKYKLDISPATVRNEMADLEAEGFIVQPHTSAGRIPTEKAFRFFSNNLKEKNLTLKESKTLGEILKKKTEENYKEAARELARVSGQAVIWALNRHNLYYTGISNLLTQPEFIESDLIYNISSVIDQLEDTIGRIFERVQAEPQILIGSENPFSDLCASIQFRYSSAGQAGLIALLAPVRMDYEKGLALMKLVHGALMVKTKE